MKAVIRLAQTHIRQQSGKGSTNHGSSKNATGHNGEEERREIWTTCYFVEPCIALAHFTMTCAPRGQISHPT